MTGIYKSTRAPADRKPRCAEKSCFQVSGVPLRFLHWHENIVMTCIEKAAAELQSSPISRAPLHCLTQLSCSECLWLLFFPKCSKAVALGRTLQRSQISMLSVTPGCFPVPAQSCEFSSGSFCKGFDEVTWHQLSSEDMLLLSQQQRAAAVQPVAVVRADGGRTEFHLSAAHRSPVARGGGDGGDCGGSC
ncbi:hypothetical protein AOLI_G00067050 [Acnodon oligacanthus]